MTIVHYQIVEPFTKLNDSVLLDTVGFFLLVKNQTEI